jgi:hypothetical protein
MIQENDPYSQVDPFMPEYEDTGPINRIGIQSQVDKVLQEIKTRIPDTPSVKLNGTNSTKHSTKQTEDKDRLHFSTIDEIMSMPETEYAVNGLLEMSTISMIVGDSEAGKTFIMLGIALAIASGREWLGRKTKQGHVVYVYAEGKLGLRKRLLAWKTHHNEELPTEHLHVIPRPINLRDTWVELRELLKTLPEHPVLIVFDTFGQVAPGVNENDAKDVREVLHAARNIKDEFESHVAIIHHGTKNSSGSGYRGSSVFLNDTDAMIEVSREDQGTTNIHCKRTKDSEHFNDFWINLQVVEYGTDETTGNALTSCVVVSVEPEERTVHASQNEAKMLSILETYGKHEGLTSAEWERRTTQIHGFSHSQFTKALRGLKNKKLVEKDDTKYRTVP